MLKSILVALAGCLCLSAAPTRIVDTLYNADGSRFAGSLTISWTGFVAPDGLNVRAGTRQVSIVGGRLSVELEPGSYTVVDSRGNKTFWLVPVSGPVNVAQIETGSIPGPNLVIALSQIPQSGAIVNQVLGWNGIVWSPQTIPIEVPYTLGFASVSFSSSPVFNTATANVFKITLAGNVTSSRISDLIAGQPVTFIICQNSAGNNTFQWPAPVRGGMVTGTAANTCSVQEFISDGTSLYSTTAGIVNQ